MNQPRNGKKTSMHVSTGNSWHKIYHRSILSRFFSGLRIPSGCTLDHLLWTPPINQFHPCPNMLNSPRFPLDHRTLGQSSCVNSKSTSAQGTSTRDQAAWTRITVTTLLWSCEYTSFKSGGNYTYNLQLHGGFHKWGYPNSWMVIMMEHPIQMDDLRGPPF